MSRKQRRRQEKMARRQSAIPPGPMTGEAMQAASQAFQAGELEQAARLLGGVRRGNPENFDATLGLAVVHATQGDFGAAIPLFEKACALRPGDAEAHFNRGRALADAGRLEDAAAAYGRALAINPREEGALINMGNVQRDRGDLAGAAESFRRALAVNPGQVLALSNLGDVRRRQRRFEEALAALGRALEIEPGTAGIHANMGNVYMDLERPADALACYERALAAEPGRAELHGNRGNALKGLGRLDAAAAAYAEAITLDPGYARAHNNLGILWAERRRHDEAVGCFRRAFDIDPAYEAAAVNLLHALQHVCAWDDFETLKPTVHGLTAAAIADGRPIGDVPFPHLSQEADPEANLRTARAKSREIAAAVADLDRGFPAARPPAASQASSKITIGYLSADFHDHATAHLMRGLFKRHDRAAFNVFTFSHGIDDDSAYRRDIREFSDAFFDIRTTGSPEAARQIHDSGVDILIDLKGHTRHNRLEICALRPAPVQATYLGFPGTSGADFFDYILTDRIVTPEAHAPYYSERIAYLPDAYQVTDNTQEIPDAALTRAEAGLPETGIVFCSFNAAYKIEPVMFGAWMRLLRRVPMSVLWLLESNDAAERALRREAEAAGVEPGRLVFAPIVPRAEHLRRLCLADLALDTRICGGHTTTSDALWAGVPVVALTGGHFASRVATSLLSAVGLPELAAPDLGAYEALALDLAQDAEKLAALRARLAQNRESQPLFDTERFTRNLETAYRRMWDAYRRGEAPPVIDVADGQSE